jgi:nucleoside-diphosphate-sugar epimerase
MDAKLKVLTGATGSLGSIMPADFKALKTRLEGSVEAMTQELQSLKSPISSFVHLAGLVQVAECQRCPAKAWSLNVDGTTKWFEAAAAVGVGRFVFASTCHVHGRVPEGSRITASTPLNPITVYASTKLAAERRLMDLARKKPSTRLVIVRLFSVLSPTPRPGSLLDGLAKRALGRDYSPIPGLDHVRDFLEASEVVSRIVKLTETPDPPSIVLVCSGKPTRIREIAKEVFIRMGIETSMLEGGSGHPGDVPWIVGIPTAF